MRSSLVVSAAVLAAVVLACSEPAGDLSQERATEGDVTGGPSDDAPPSPSVPADGGATEPKTDAGAPPPSSGTPGQCSVEVQGGTGDEPGGVIPVCCAPTTAEKADVDELFGLLNEYRASMGLPAMTYDASLEAAIQGHTLHMFQHDFFSHSAPELAVRTFSVRAPQCGAEANAEILQEGAPTPAGAMKGWKSSPGHHAQLLKPWTRVGVGHAGTYWAMLFGE